MHPLQQLLNWIGWLVVLIVAPSLILYLLQRREQPEEPNYNTTGAIGECEEQW